MATTNPFISVTIPAGNPKSAHTGQIRLNTTSYNIEIWDGHHWLPMAGTDLKTWQEWFKYFGDMSIDGMDRWGKRDYIEREMQARFPGNYRVDLAGNHWTMVFDTPADETWFNLKYT